MRSTQSLTTVQTFLRPNFHQWFPVFTPEQMHERLATMPFELATLLRPRNVRLAVQIDSAWSYLRYLRQPPTVKQILLSEVLQSSGIAFEVAEAVASERHRFALPNFRPMAYMDRSLPVAGQTYLSAPGVVALMLSLSRGLKPNAVACEIGIGTGLHALALAKVEPHTFVVGIERSVRAFSLAQNNIEQAHFSHRSNLLGHGDTDWAIANADFVYSTAALSLAQLARLTRYGRLGSIWLVPRQLTREEFEAEPEQSWLWRTYGDYNGYCAGSWNQFLALERFRLEAGGRRRREAIVYDVRFVRYDDRP